MLKKLFIAVILMTCYSVKSQTTVVDSIVSGGIYRTYRLYVPAIYNGSSARPLVFNLHGYTSNATAQQQYTIFEPIADTANFLMVFPQGTKDGSSQPFWNAGMSSSLVNDIAFLNALIDSLDLTYNIDLNAVYSCGMSNGGFMSHTLACESSNRFTAIASVTGSIFTTQYGANCHPTRPVPAMQISGTADGTVPYAGGSGMMPIDSVVKYWVTKNNCNPTAAFSNVPNTSTSDGCTAEHYVYSGGNLGSSVELYKVIGGGHTWPGSPFIIGTTNQDFSASKEIWRFFRQYRLNLLTNALEIEKENLNFSIYPNPAYDVLNVSFSKEDKQAYSIDVTDVLGKVMASKHEGIDTIDLSALNSGIYFITLKKNGMVAATQKFVKK